MFEPAIAPVRPRVASPVTGDSVLLEDEVLDFLEHGASGVILLLGDRGSGKTTALRHLAAVVSDGYRLSLIDDSDNQQMPLVPDGGIVICSRRISPGWRFLAELRLLPWGRDEWIEYLLATKPCACGEVLSRVFDGDLLDGSPQWWRIVLDALINDPTLPNVSAAVESHLRSILPSEDLRRSAADFCLSSLLYPDHLNGAIRQMRKSGMPPEQVVVIYHRPIRVRLGVEAVIDKLGSLKRPTVLHTRMPRDLVEAVGRSLKSNDKILSGLKRLLSRRHTTKTHSMAASLLRFAEPLWHPGSLAKGLSLQGAYLDRVDWSTVNVTKGHLSDANFEGATLDEADFEETSFSRAIFRGASLQRTSLINCEGHNVDFTGADLTKAILNGADLHNASFVDANLTRSRLVGASLVAADFTRTHLNVANLAKAELTDACFVEADLTDAEFAGALLQNVDLRTVIVERTSFRGSRLFGANLEEVDWPDAQLAEVNLREAHLTGSTLHRADLRKADLTGALLGEIDWEEADLREADLSEASFHMGSSREGLLSSPFASEGTRTGFYTDEYTEQHYKPPEEIRKANLRGCDLRGANIEGVDFYLVDLRDALLDPDQISYVEACGAILTSEE